MDSDIEEATAMMPLATQGILPAIESDYRRKLYDCANC